MAYASANNIPPDRNRLNRPAYDQVKNHRYFQQHSFDDLTTTAKELNAWIRAQGEQYKPLSCRSHVEITNTHATATVYVGRSATTSSSIYQYKLSALGGYVKIPMDADHVLYLISDTASTTLVVTELG